MSRLRSQRGQATIDYVALLSVLALLLGVTATVASGSTGVANAVLGQFRRALCIVTGASCATERRQPCVLASDRDGHHTAVTIAFIRIDEDRYVLRERLSDGTVRLTLAERDGAGVEAGVGGRARLKVKGHDIGFDREARGGGEGVVGHGEVYVAGSDREADKILDELRHDVLPFHYGGPKPSAIFFEGGVRGLGHLGIGGSKAGGSLGGMQEGVLGARRDAGSGDVTISLSVGSSGSSLLNALLAGASGASDRNIGMSLTLDRHGSPATLSLNASGSVAAGSSLPAGISDALASGGAARNGTSGRRWDFAASVDLHDPDVAAAWKAFRQDPRSADAIRELGSRLREEARLDVHSYAIRSDSSGVSGAVGLGVKLGGELEHTTDRATLLSAATRPPFGLWEPRVDCENLGKAA